MRNVQRLGNKPGWVGGLPPKEYETARKKLTIYLNKTKSDVCPECDDKGYYQEGGSLSPFIDCDCKKSKRYKDVIEMMEGEKIPRKIIDEVKRMIEEDKKNLTTVMEDGKVFIVDKRTGEKL